jgi:hypothetical protein
MSDSGSWTFEKARIGIYDEDIDVMNPGNNNRGSPNHGIDNKRREFQ